MPLKALANYSPPTAIHGIVAQGGLTFENADIHTKDIQTSIRIYPLYTQVQSRYRVVTPRALKSTVAVRYIEAIPQNPEASSSRGISSPSQGHVARSQVRIDGQGIDLTMTECDACIEAGLRPLIKRERAVFKKRFSVMWDIWQDIFEDEPGPSPKPADYRCCSRSGTLSLKEGENVVETDSIALNTVYYLPTSAQRLRADGYFSADYLAGTPCEGAQDPPARTEIRMQMFGHTACNEGRPCPSLEPSPEPHVVHGKQRGWQYENACPPEATLHVDVPIEITGYDKGIRNNFGIGVAESLMSRHLLEEYREILVPPEAIKTLTDSGYRKDHPPKNAFDGDMVGTSWESDAQPSDDGLGLLNLEFFEPTAVAAVGIVPGRRLRPVHLINSGRPQKVTLSTDGQQIIDAELTDTPWSVFTLPIDMQVVTFPEPMTLRNLSINVREVYPGKKYPHSASVGEVVLFSKTPKSPLDSDFPIVSSSLSGSPATDDDRKPTDPRAAPKANPMVESRGTPNCGCNVPSEQTTSLVALWRAVFAL